MRMIDFMNMINEMRCVMKLSLIHSIKKDFVPQFPGYLFAHHGSKCCSRQVNSHGEQTTVYCFAQHNTKAHSVAGA